MKKLVLFTFLLTTAFILWNCEKDDICDPVTPVTPKMIVEFYDNNNSTVKKAVTDLGIVADGFTEGMLFDGVSKIEVPLKTTEDITKFSFILDAENPIPSLRNTDNLEINYTRNDVFVSRACGYKTLYTLNNPGGINLTPDANNWIKQIVIQKYNIANEDEVHVKIFF
ncbi:DUF6452 family protein [Flavobacterium sp.]|uniref:DUF6452 family protein n=1 Tax=Flavobacterium sp. TaxID=239 RepID=UPI003D6B6D9B